MHRQRIAANDGYKREANKRLRTETGEAQRGRNKFGEDGKNRQKRKQEGREVRKYSRNMKS